MKMNHYCIALVVAALAATLFSCRQTADESAIKAGEISVSVPMVRSVTLRKSYPGYLSAVKEVEVKAPVGGCVTSAPYVAGPVKKGDVLFIIDDSSCRKAVDKAKSELQTALANLNSARRSLAGHASNVTGETTGADMVQARDEVARCEDAVKSAESALAAAQTRLNGCTVRAPFSGIVANSMVDTGSVIQPDQTLTTMFDNTRFCLNFEIDHEQYESMTDSNGVMITKEVMPVAFADKLPHNYVASISEVDSSDETSDGTFRLQAYLDNPHNELHAGMYVTIDLPYARVDSAVVVPSAAVRLDERGHYMLTVDADSTAVYTPVMLGQNIGDSLVVISQGLLPGTAFIACGSAKVQPGQKIAPAE